MILSKNHFFLVLFSILIIPVLLQKFIWLAGSRQTNGICSFIGKEYAGQMVYSYSVIAFPLGSDTVWFNGRNGILYQEGAIVPVRHQVNNPADARINSFISIWGDTLVYGGIPVLILLAIFLHPQIVPFGRRVRIRISKPFFSVLR